jgi:hypothetical protein
MPAHVSSVGVPVENAPEKIIRKMCARCKRQLLLGIDTCLALHAVLTNNVELTLSRKENVLPSRLKINCSWSSTVEPGKRGRPLAISKKIHPTPLHTMAKSNFRTRGISSYTQYVCVCLSRCKGFHNNGFVTINKSLMGD